MSTTETARHIIDLDALPYAPKKWRVESHVLGGLWEWDPEKIPPKNPKESVWEVDLNANVLDWLLANPERIPEEWKRKRIIFKGTRYRAVSRRDRDEYTALRCLCFNNQHWHWAVYRLKGYNPFEW